LEILANTTSPQKKWYAQQAESALDHLELEYLDVVEVEKEEERQQQMFQMGMQKPFGGGGGNNNGGGNNKPKPNPQPVDRRVRTQNPGTPTKNDRNPKTKLEAQHADDKIR
jgi:hypothetical protein